MRIVAVRFCQRQKVPQQAQLRDNEQYQKNKKQPVNPAMRRFEFRHENP